MATRIKALLKPPGSLFIGLLRIVLRSYFAPPYPSCHRIRPARQDEGGQSRPKWAATGVPVKITFASVPWPFSSHTTTRNRVYATRCIVCYKRLR